YSSFNKHLTWDDVINGRYKIYDWDWNELSRHPNITMDIISSHPHHPWRWKYVWDNPNMTWEFICDNHSHPSHSFESRFVGYHPCVTLEHIQNHPDIFPSPRDILHYYAYNPNITLKC